MTNLVALPEGTELVGDYRIERALGAGGFGITYLAVEIPLARRVTIKEYFPVDFAARNGADDVCPRSQESAADYSWGLDRFLAEAQTLAKFNHPNIVRVYRYFRDRNTGYIALHFEEGSSLKGWLKALGRAPRQAELDRIVPPMLDALEVIHAADFLHRDIAPDNIIIRRDGSPVLIDFGSARAEVAKHSKTVSALVKPGYSPYEQYGTDGRQQGPWTDIYSLGATLYQAITGKRPPDAPTRMILDEYVPARDAALSSYRPGFLTALDHALRLEPGKRPRTVAEWRAELMAPAAKRPTARQMLAEALQPAKPAAPPPPPEPIVIPAEPPPPLPPVQVPRVEAARVQMQQPAARQPGLIAEFLKGWSGGSGAGEAAATPVPVAPPRAAPAPHAAPPPPPRAVVVTPPPTPVPERRAPPRAIRFGSRTRWRGLAAKLALGLGIAAVAVSLQDRSPAPTKVEIKGETTVLSQSGETVPIGQLKGHRGTITSVAFSADGRQIVTAAEDARLRVWNAATRVTLTTIELDNGAAASLAVEGRRAVTGHRDGSVVVWDLDSGQKVTSFKRNGAGVLAATFMGDGNKIAAAASDGVVALWDAKAPAAPVHVLDGHDGAVQGLGYSGRGGHLASAGADKTIRLWAMSGPTLTRVYKGHNEAIDALAMTVDGRKLASASADGEIRISSTQSSRTHFKMRVAIGRITALAFSPDGELLASVGEDGIVRLWDVKRGRILRSLQSHTGGLRAIVFSPDGRRVAAAGNDGLVRLWDASVPRPGT
ncbi:MAG: WD40 repeat domain-containing serine/threonine protein kinase [Hyphomicrobiaceae bacterium]